jgi:hypothetical protein
VLESTPRLPVNQYCMGAISLHKSSLQFVDISIATDSPFRTCRECSIGKRRDTKIQEIREVFRSQGISVQIIVATDGDVERFGNDGAPETYIVDKNGRIRVLHYGSLPDVVSYLEADIAAMSIGPAN